eukprot:5500365-Pyramimonas_sp.AAC.1
MTHIGWAAFVNHNTRLLLGPHRVLLRCIVQNTCNRERRRQADEKDRAELLSRLNGDDVARTLAEERGYDPEVGLTAHFLTTAPERTC